MNIITICSTKDFQKLAGEELGSSDWLTVDQNMIDLFAEATLDHQWIHVDPVRAEKESPFESTIAHGYLLVSLIPQFLGQIISVKNLERLVNYGIDKLVFKAPVKVNSRLRMKAIIKSTKDLGMACLATIQCLMEVENSETSVVDGTIKYLYYFK